MWRGAQMKSRGNENEKLIHALFGKLWAISVDEENTMKVVACERKRLNYYMGKESWFFNGNDGMQN